MKAKLDQLLETATDTDKVELKILHNASVSCLKSYNEEPTAAKKKDWDMARAGLDDAITRMWPVYFPDEDKFETAKEALAYLKNKGYKIAKSKFYADRGKKLQDQKDGSILKRDLLLYAKSLKYLGDPAAGLDQAQRKKLQLETEKLSKQTALLDHDLKVKQGAYVERAEAEMARAATISIIEATNKNMYSSHAAEWVALVKGDQSMVGAFIDAINQVHDDVYNQLARLEEFTVSV